ncbi:MAG TPA: hypothetical protein VFJ58_03145 [Armatimonadota bacterium]|nr:hypothetical protein [Armatimonadota bacterium]
MDTWQGEFGWQSHALTGRPDLLNYLRQGDFRWPDLWSFFEQRGAPPGEGLARCIRLFHQFCSWQLDLAGHVVEDDCEIAADLIAWGRYCVQHPEEIPEARIREDLTALAEAGAISPAYFECAYRCFLRALVEEHSGRWLRGETSSDRLDGLDDVTPCVGYGRLKVYVPEDAPELPIAANPQWQRYKRALAQREHDAWCASYASIIERLEDMTDERPGL